LARAIAAKNSNQKSDSLTVSSGPSRSGSPVPNSESPRQSLDAASVGSDSKADHVAGGDTQVDDGFGASELQQSAPEKNVQTDQKSNGVVLNTEAEIISRPSTESTRSSARRESMDSTRQQSSGARASIETRPPELGDAGLPLKASIETETLLKQLQTDFETSELQRQEEVHGYIERIDALQAKLQYLARESAESARKASSLTSPGSLEKKLADKEEQIALLMEEGQKLSKKELNHLSTIKKLRAKIHEDSKDLVEVRKRQEKAERDAAFAAARLKRIEGSEKLVHEKQRLITQLQRDIESLKAERDSRDLTIAGLKTQLEEAVAQGKQIENKIAHESLELEKKRVAALEDDVANLKIEKKLVADRAQSQIKEMREKMDKSAERARISELEMKAELQMLESKLEVMRARAEEVSSGATGDAQAKLLRQIETLQTQYAVASENWQGIEASLIARATNIEKERDEAVRRETDIRRKAREVVCYQ
jgi:DNA repair exonuclease SbcCD ATPase subunit